MNKASASGQNDRSDGAHSNKKRPLRTFVLLLGLACILGIWIFRESLRQAVFNRGILSNEAPTAEAVNEMIRNAANPQSAILAVWNTGKIVQQEVAMAAVTREAAAGGPLPEQLRTMVLAGALAPDVDVRETALNDLDYRNDPALAALAAAQLRDLDPQVRLLGLLHLKQTPAKVGVPLVAPLLDDGDPQIVAYALKKLENWSGEKFGVKLSDAVPTEDSKTGLTVFNEDSYARTRAGAERAKGWWRDHKTNFEPVHLEIPAEARAFAKPTQAADFRLRALDGSLVRLADFRGKVVLINFWTTWCTACVSEMPELIALHKEYGDHLVILGVSMDFVPDEDAPDQPKSPDAIREKVNRTVKARGINYPVLLDEHNEIGSRFNGGELPTTVIVDGDGNVRRRFIGTRSLSVFEAMITEASQRRLE